MEKVAQFMLLKRALFNSPVDHSKTAINYQQLILTQKEMLTLKYREKVGFKNNKWGSYNFFHSKLRKNSI